MRRLLTLFAALVSVIGVASSGASQGASPAADCVETTEDENEAIVRGWYAEVLNQDDLEVIDEIIAEEAGHSTSVFPDSGSRAETKAIVSSLLASFPDQRNTVQETITDGDLVVVRWTSTGTFENAFQGFPPTGEQTTWTGINIFRIDCGMIAES